MTMTTSTTTKQKPSASASSRYERYIQQIPNRILVLLPLILPLYLIFHIIIHTTNTNTTANDNGVISVASFSSLPRRLYYYMGIAIVIGYMGTQQFIPIIQQYTLRKGIHGKDLGKRETVRADLLVPEALGIVPGVVFLICLIACLVGFNTTMTNNNPTNNANHNNNNQNTLEVLEINTALLAICFMLLLGFTDDVLDWPWRYKLVLPMIAALPIVTCYTGPTTIVIPIPFRSILWNAITQQPSMVGRVVRTYLGMIVDPYDTLNDTLLDVQYIYYLYMCLLSIFCTNAINIYAGINGLEVGQSYIIATAILVYNCIEIITNNNYYNNNNSSSSNNIDDGTEMEFDANHHHIFSIMVILSFIGVSIGLLQYNWYPAQVFVGDTYCYFAGMTFAVVGIFGHFSKTLLLFFIPQILNFVWSVPQLFYLVPCPRHRLPFYNAETGLMEPSTFVCKPHHYQWLKRLNGPERIHDTVGVNMTMINVCLQLCGPLSERTLCITLLFFQMICCTFGFLCRYYIAGFFF